MRSLEICEKVKIKGTTEEWLKGLLGAVRAVEVGSRNFDEFLKTLAGGQRRKRGKHTK